MTKDQRNTSQRGQSVIEYALILLLIAIIILAILLILGDDLRAFVFDLLQTWFPEQIN
jgi:Flp pilus assembly pilin Flp